MNGTRKFGEDHINQALKQIDTDHWTIGDFSLRRLPPGCESASWSDDLASWVVTEASTTLPPAKKLDSPYIKLIHEAGDASAVWSIGSCAFCKVRYRQEGVTPEPVTLNFVRNKHPSFDVPKVLFYEFDSDRSYLFLERLPGRTLDVAWPSLDDFWRYHYVDSAVRICQEMAQWKGKKVGGVDGQHVLEYYLVSPPGSDNFGSVQAGCMAIGMAESDVVFCHADLGPTNLIVEDKPLSGSVGVLDFEIAGFFPRGWVRTKFRLSSGMDLSSSDRPTWWRAEVQKALEAKGFQDHVQAWLNWRGYT